MHVCTCTLRCIARFTGIPQLGICRMATPSATLHRCFLRCESQCWWACVFSSAPSYRTRLFRTVAGSRYVSITYMMIDSSDARQATVTESAAHHIDKWAHIFQEFSANNHWCWKNIIHHEQTCWSADTHPKWPTTQADLRHRRSYQTTVHAYLFAGQQARTAALCLRRTRSGVLARQVPEVSHAAECQPTSVFLLTACAEKRGYLHHILTFRWVDAAKVLVLQIYATAIQHAYKCQPCDRYCPCTPIWCDAKIAV